MARVSAHGTEIGTVHFLYTAKRYMSDRTVLKNVAGDWKISGKIKPHLTPQEAYEKAYDRVEQLARELPSAGAYRRELHALAGLSGGKRARLHMTVELMPDDPDGVWSECCDGYGDNVHADLDDVVSLCRAYKGMLLEQKIIAEAKAEAAIVEGGAP